MKKTSDSKKPPIDRVPLTELKGRYGLGYTGINSRLNRLGMKLAKEGRRSYVSAQQLEILDRLDQHIKAGGTIQSFLNQQSAPEESKKVDSLSPEILNVSHQGTIAELVKAIAALKVPVTIQIGTDVDRFAYYRVLEESAEKGWELTTSEVAELLKIPVAEIEGDIQAFRQAGFVFSPCETTGHWESRWKVVKAEN